MLYAVIALFDENTDRLVRNIWKELSKESISLYAEQVKDRIPHITLASYNDLDVEEFVNSMDNHYNQQNGIDLTLSTLGTFLQSGTLFYSPVVTESLIDFHLNHHRSLHKFNDDPESFYLPGKWIPHCTLANGLSQDKLVEAFNHCSKRNEPFNGQIEKIALVKTFFENGTCVEAPVIFSKKLNNPN